MTSKVYRTCTCCNGAGVVEISGVYLDTLRLLRGQKSPRSGADLARLAGCTGEAMANRLQRLAELDLARYQPAGRRKLWTAI